MDNNNDNLIFIIIIIIKVSVWVVGVAGLVAGMAPRTGPRDPGQSNVGLQVGKSPEKSWL